MRKTVRRILTIAGLLVLIIATAAVTVGIRTAQREAIRSRTFGRLSQLRLAVASYEARHGELPPRHATDLEGNPTHSWLAFILPEWPEINVFGSLDLSRSWKETAARKASPGAEQVTQWFREDGLVLCALEDDRSIWQPETGMPIGTISQFPDSVLLLAVPVEDVHPLQPFSLNEKALRQLLADGKDVLFVTCGGDYGNAQVQNDEVEFGPPRPTRHGRRAESPSE